MEISQTADYALQALNAIHSEGELTVPELAETLQVGRNVSQRIMATLHQQELVRRKTGGKYVLGVGMISLGNSVKHPLIKLAKDEMLKLATKSQELILLSICHEGQVELILKRNLGQFPLQVEYALGYRHDLTQGAAGQVFLAWMDPKNREEILDGKDLGFDFEQIREQGFAISEGAVAAEMKGVAAPVIDQLDEVHATISIVAPTARGEVPTKFAADVVEAGKRLGKAYRVWLDEQFADRELVIDGEIAS